MPRTVRRAGRALARACHAPPTAARRAAALGLATLLSVLLGIPAAHGDPRDDKRRIDAEVARSAAILEDATARAQDAAARYSAASAALPGAQRRVDEARGRVAAAQAGLNTARRAERLAADALAVANRRYRQAVAQVERARERIGQFAAAAYKGSGLAALDSLFTADGPIELADRIGYLDRVVAEQRRAVDQLTAARRAARQASNDAELARQRATRARREAAAALARARTVQAEAEAAATAVAQLVQQRRGALATAQQERAASLARYRELSAERTRIEAELRAWQARQAELERRRRHTGDDPPERPGLRDGARLLMPVHGWKSSDFGWRYDPYYHVWQLHAGTDFAAGMGQPVYAAAGGRVVMAWYNGGYGRYTCLSHGRYRGRWLTTCYAHQSQILVRVGERVEQGQMIGRVGSTGASTGSHLHFEVRLDGGPVNPLPWLPNCLC